MLEDEVMGNLYETFLNTNLKDDKKEFNSFPLNYKAYDYSVTTITTLTSILLTIMSCGLCVFYLAILVLKQLQITISLLNILIWAFFILLFAVFIGTFFSSWFLTGNDFTENKNTNNRWYQRKI